MSERFTPTTCRICNRGFDLANPWNDLNPTASTAWCPNCGKWTEVDAETMAKARERRGETDKKGAS